MLFNKEILDENVVFLLTSCENVQNIAKGKQHTIHKLFTGWSNHWFIICLKLFLATKPLVEHLQI